MNHKSFKGHLVLKVLCLPKNVVSHAEKRPKSGLSSESFSGFRRVHAISPDLIGPKVRI